MSAPKADPEVYAVNTIVQSLRPLDTEAQQRVLQSSLALLGLAIAGRPQTMSEISSPLDSVSVASTPYKLKGLTELLLEKKPGTNSQRIVLFAYYRRHVEKLDTFHRQDLKPYFAKARIAPPANYDRDFANAVTAGWIHEDNANSYVTNTGEQLVEAGFEGERSYSAPSKRDRSKSRVRKAKKKTQRRN